VKQKTQRHAPERAYYVREEGGRYYIYYLEFSPVETLFDIKHTREEAAQAIKEHKDGKHDTQWKPEEKP